ncbi:hypothetical protein AMS68_004567 [Peltaster fructicola]|uniref:Uncharacterized protein n=1 Tax=Peltaster fructicola TaxID=286661 RepID=A0A6H0XX94_9PEZI|nr:hypothetical protein AMS68_004567 [Peltaster fructicola]
MALNLDVTVAWAVRVGTAELGACLQAYKRALPAIIALRTCNRFGQGDEAYVTRLPIEVVHTVERHLIADGKKHYVDKWRQREECAQYMTCPDLHLMVEHLTREELIRILWESTCYLPDGDDDTHDDDTHDDDTHDDDTHDDDTHDDDTHDDDTHDDDTHDDDTHDDDTHDDDTHDDDTHDDDTYDDDDEADELSKTVPLERITELVENYDMVHERHGMLRDEWREQVKKNALYTSCVGDMVEVHFGLKTWTSLDRNSTVLPTTDAEECTMTYLILHDPLTSSQDNTRRVNSVGGFEEEQLQTSVSMPVLSTRLSMASIQQRFRRAINTLGLTVGTDNQSKVNAARTTHEAPSVQTASGASSAKQTTAECNKEWPRLMVLTKANCEH